MSPSASSIHQEGDHPPGQYRASSVVQTTPSQQMATVPSTPTQRNTSTNTPPQAPRRISSIGSVPPSMSHLMGTMYPTASYTGPSLGFNTNITLGNSPYIPTGLQTGGPAVSAANLPKIPPNVTTDRKGKQWLQPASSADHSQNVDGRHFEELMSLIAEQSPKNLPPEFYNQVGSIARNADLNSNK